MADFLLVIATPERQVYEGRVDSLTVPTTTGEITILPHHMPLSTILRAGEMVLRTEGKNEPYAVSGGFIEVQPTKVVILADTAEHLNEINEEAIQQAIARAKEMQATVSRDQVQYTEIMAKLERDLNRLNVVRKYRHRGHQGITHEGVRPE